jgi:soluble lytic murein transglycosylase-like protein
MKSAILTCVTALLLAGPVLAAGSTATRQAEQYYKVRDKALHLVETFTQDEVQTQPQKFASQLLETRGTIIAVAGSENNTSLLLDTGGTAPLMIAFPPNRRREDLPFLDVAVRVRTLCRVVTAAESPSGALELVVAVKENEAEEVDAQRKKEEEAKAAALKKRSQPNVNLSSRGVSSTIVRRGTKAARKPVKKTTTSASEEALIQAYANGVRYFNRRMGVADARRIAQNIIYYSRRYGLEAQLVMAVIAVESNFNPSAVSPKGAMGLGQLMPGTASDLGVGNAYDVSQNLEGSTRLLQSHIRNFANGRPTEEAIKLALACYNAGPGAVRKYRGIPPYRETQNYVAKITRLYLQLKGEWKGD